MDKMSADHITTGTDNKVPYLVHEDMMARQERTIEKLWILCIVLIVLFVGSNAAWIYYENSFVDSVETTTIQAEQDGAGTNVIIGGDSYGTESEDNAHN